MKGVLLELPLRPYPYTLILADSRDAWLRLRAKYSPNREPSKAPAKSAGLTHFADDGKHCIVAMCAGADEGTLVHEIAHVCVFVFDEIGTAFTEATQEPFAYLMDETFTACKQALERAKTKKRNRK